MNSVFDSLLNTRGCNIDGTSSNNPISQIVDRIFESSQLIPNQQQSNPIIVNEQDEGYYLDPNLSQISSSSALFQPPHTSSDSLVDDSSLFSYGYPHEQERIMSPVHNMMQDMMIQSQMMLQQSLAFSHMINPTQGVVSSVNDTSHPGEVGNSVSLAATAKLESSSLSKENHILLAAKEMELSAEQVENMWREFQELNFDKLHSEYLGPSQEGYNQAWVNILFIFCKNYF